MSILGDRKILEAVSKGDIFISDFNEKKLNPNGYNLSLNKKLLVYTDDVLDMKKINPTKEIEIPEEGLVLHPGQLYLGKTNEFTRTSPKYVPMLEGRSSTGRLGIDVHICAGAGDAGYQGNWTLEIRVVKPVRVYANVDVCQIMYHKINGKVDKPYNGKYQGKTDVSASELFKDEIFKSDKKVDENVVNNFTKKIEDIRNGVDVVKQRDLSEDEIAKCVSDVENVISEKPIAFDTLKGVDYNDFIIPIPDPKLSDAVKVVGMVLEDFKNKKIEKFKKENPDCVLNLAKTADNTPSINIKEVSTILEHVIKKALDESHKFIKLDKTVSFDPEYNMIQSTIPIPKELLREDIKELVITHNIYI